MPNRAREGAARSRRSARRRRSGVHAAVTVSARSPHCFRTVTPAIRLRRNFSGWPRPRIR